MTDTTQTAIIVAIPPTLMGIAAIIASLRNAKKLEGIHILMNSRLSELLKLTKESSFAEGEKAQKDKPHDSAA